jgi:3-methyl-2-oxobutanoate hydroxymethyltransferase
MIYHTEMVVRAAQHALVIMDLPFPTFQLGPVAAIESSARALKESGCQAVKMEGGRNRFSTLQGIVQAGIPVMGHIGLTPQEIHQMGGYRPERNREKLIDDARGIEEAGAFSVVLEYVPAGIAKEITDLLKIPTIGIGSGPDCDGQILVFHDLFGVDDRAPLRHVRQYAELGVEIKRACRRYCEDIRKRNFPQDEHALR